MVINIDVKVETESLPEEGMFNFLIQYSVKNVNLRLILT